jgi:hypothetical protein
MKIFLQVTDRIGVAGRKCGDLLLQIGYSLLQAGLLVFEGFDVQRMQLYIILGKKLQRVVLEVGEPGIFFTAEARIDARFILITFSGNAQCFEPFGKGGPF